jgi:hypothetical protein
LGGGSTSLALFALLAFPLYGFRITSLDQVPENLFRNLESPIQFGHGLRGQNHINKHVVTITMMIDGIGEAATAPLVDLHNLPIIIGDNLFDTI